MPLRIFTIPTKVESLNLIDLLSTLYTYQARLLLWTAATILLYALATSLLDRARRTPPSRLGLLYLALDRSQWKPPLYTALGLGFFLGIPYLALVRGVTNPWLMGLLPSDWVTGIGLGTVLGLGTFLFLFVAWAYYLRALPPEEAGRILLTQPQGWWAILEVVQLEAHWAFLRSAPLVLWGDYYGVFVGLGLVYLEGWTHPQTRRQLGRSGQEGILWTASLALSTSVIFYFTKNLWLTAALHLGIELGLSFLLRSRFLPAAQQEIAS